jgi:ferredoxin
LGRLLFIIRLNPNIIECLYIILDYCYNVFYVLIFPEVIMSMSYVHNVHNVNNVQHVYKDLARVLDGIPNGYPETESGVELKILARLFTPGEAQLACHLELEGQTAKAIAQRTGGDEREIFADLKAMTKKELIKAERGEGGLAFKLMPFIVGFYEGQNSRIDEEFAELFETYYKEALHNMMAVKPSVHRVIPIEETIPVNVEVMPYERASTYLEEANSWGVLRCICRVQQKLVGKGCDHSVDNCLLFTTKANAFARSKDIRPISKEEALDILKNAAEEGLVHATDNVREGVNYICNCCTCSCGILRGLSEFGHVNAMGCSDFYAQVDASLCTGCGACVDRCQFTALDVVNDICEVDRARCYGCGQCITVCPVEAIELKQKTAAEIEPPPANESQWREVRAAARGL